MNSSRRDGRGFRVGPVERIGRGDSGPRAEGRARKRECEVSWSLVVGHHELHTGAGRMIRKGGSAGGNETLVPVRRKFIAMDKILRRARQDELRSDTARLIGRLSGIEGSFRRLELPSAWPLSSLWQSVSAAILCTDRPTAQAYWVAKMHRGHTKPFDRT